MPIFEYECQECGGRFEQLVMNREAAVDCPTCHNSDVVKLFSAFSMQTAPGFSGLMGAGCGCAPSG